MNINDLFYTSPPEPKAGSFVDRFGVSTRVNYLPGIYAAYSGKVGSLDGSDNLPIHAAAEYECLYRALNEAEGRDFAVTELGAGWAPWLVLSAFAARRRGLRPVLTGIEGSSDHLGFMKSHFSDNGLNILDHRIEHAVVGSYDGVAYFPISADPSADWSGEAKFRKKPILSFLRRASSDDASTEEVRCISLRTLLTEIAPQDIVHCDVQGAEADVFESAIDVVNLKVRRVYIGTHGRAIEERLMALFSMHGWIIESDTSCIFQQDKNTKKLLLRNDGEQIWRNPRL